MSAASGSRRSQAYSGRRTLSQGSSRSRNEHANSPYGTRATYGRTAQRSAPSSTKRQSRQQSRVPYSGEASADSLKGKNRHAAQPQTSSRSLPLTIVLGIASFFKAVFKGIGNAFSWLWQKSRIAGVALLVLLLVGCFALLDGAFTAERIYKGVSIGDVDVSNMSIDEAAQAVSDSYNPRLNATSVYIFADEETAQSEDLDLHMAQSDALAEQLSFEEAQANKKLWITSAQALEATLPAQTLAEKAFQVGRDSGILERIGAAFSGVEVPVYADFNETLLSNLIADINATLGYPVEDYGVRIVEGVAEVTDGNVGYQLDNNAFTELINEKLLEDESSIVSFVADVQYTPYKIDRQAAVDTCDAINAVTPESILFDSKGKQLGFQKAEYGEWISTKAVEADGAWKLEPYIDYGKASYNMMAAVNEDGTGIDAQVSFVKDGDAVYVQTASQVSIPNLDEALGELDTALFGGYRDTGDAAGVADVPTITINSREFSGRMPVDEALTYGLVSKFSVFTTQYTNTSSTENRTFNIHLAADRISNSIATANGGQWSFNDVAGPCDEANGFKEAGVIESGEYTTGIGGGICQVATTVFNSVYASGLPIKERHNHTLYSASYPAGRDAAIAYPSMDLVWVNDTSSDVLLRTSYTDTSITVSLIGTSPRRTVSTDTGDWTEGKKHGTKYEVDENLAPNASYVKISGTDGMAIKVKRTVKDASGNVIINDTFESVYSPITRVIAFGENSDMEALKAKYNEDERT